MDGVLKVKARTSIGEPCKKCGANLRYLRDSACVQCMARRTAAWTAANQERQRVKTATWVTRNRLRSLELKAAWARRNKAHISAKRALQRARLLQRTPKWLTADDKSRMRRVYEEAARRTRATGVPHHVDHIYPLNGLTVSGLHVPDNLRVVPAAVNLAKGNRYVG